MVIPGLQSVLSMDIVIIIMAVIMAVMVIQGRVVIPNVHLRNLALLLIRVRIDLLLNLTIGSLFYHYGSSGYNYYYLP